MTKCGNEGLDSKYPWESEKREKARRQDVGRLRACVRVCVCVFNNGWDLKTLHGIMETRPRVLSRE